MTITATSDPPLYWALRRQAAKLGITSVPELAARTGVIRQSLYPLWREESDNVSLMRLEQLGRTMGENGQKANMGDWFQWQGNQLRWNIRNLAARRLKIKRLPEMYWAVGRPPQQVQIYWDGTAKFVFIRTLAVLARPFIAADEPFDTGDFFSWEPSPVATIESTEPVPALA